MATVVNTLYPPQIDTFQPAFINEKPAVIYFSLSPLNGKTEIKKVQVTVCDQKTNENCLSTASGVLFYSFSDASIQQDKDTGRYYLSILPEQLKSGKWEINRFYKIQLRFDNCTKDPGKTVVSEIEYINSNTINFSEWSTVCLIKPILRPHVALVGLEENAEELPSYNKGQMPIVGKLYFGNNSKVETETMSSYSIDIVPKEKETPVYNTETVYTNNNLNPNEINYTINLSNINDSDGTEFAVVVNYKTKNEYEGKSKPFPFTIAGYSSTDWNPTCTFEIDDEEALVRLKITNPSILGHLYLTRASSADNFKNWETVAAYRLNGKVDVTFADETVGSHIWYKYRAQFKSLKGVWSDITDFVETVVENPNEAGSLVFPEFYDAFISRMGQQLAVRYDFKVSNYKPITNRVKIDTLGSKYPRFAENAVLGYKQFTLSGIISSEADVNQHFLNKSEYYDNLKTEYDNYLETNNIKKQQRNDFLPKGPGNYRETTQYDYFWEREFREEVISWLNDGEPKLFRSMTEGLIPVMLTDISLTPNDTLGRRIWSFTATAYQVGEGHSLKELDSLGIINIPGYGDDDIDSPDIPDIDFTETLIPVQLFDYWPTKVDLKDNTEKLDVILGDITAGIREKYVGIRGAMEPQLFPGENFYIKNLKVRFMNIQHIFKIDESREPVLTDPTKEDLSNAALASGKINIATGYRMGITAFDKTNAMKQIDTTIMVSPKGYYQTPSDVEVTSLKFWDTNKPNEFNGDHVLVEGIAYYREKATAGSEVTKTSVVKNIVGQEQGVFQPNDYLGQKIRRKHTYIQNFTEGTNVVRDSYQRMEYFSGIGLEVTPYAVAKIRYYKENDYTSVIVGPTGMLNLMNDYPVQELCFLGRRMVRRDASRADFLKEYEFVLDKSAPVPGGEITTKTWHLFDTTDTEKVVFVNSEGRDIPMFTDEWQVTSAGDIAAQSKDGEIRPLTADEINQYVTYTSFDDVKRPKFNHVYLIGTGYFIYYIDGTWYPVKSWSHDGQICIPEIPIQGQINYKGQIVKATYR